MEFASRLLMEDHHCYADMCCGGVVMPDGRHMPCVHKPNWILNTVCSSGHNRTEYFCPCCASMYLATRDLQCHECQDEDNPISLMLTHIDTPSQPVVPS
jgi:hypothetical protein